MADLPNELRRDSRLPTWFAITIASIVTMVWTITYLADIFIREFSPSWPVHAAFLVVLAAVFGIEFVVRTRDK